MSDHYTLTALPTPVFLDRGDTVTLRQILKASYGELISYIEDVRIAYWSATTLQDNSFWYWETPLNETLGTVLNNDIDIGADFMNITTVTKSHFSDVTIKTGNNICANVFIEVAVGGTGSDTEYRELAVKIVNPIFDHAPPNHGVPDAGDVAAAASAFGNYYSGTPNINDCHFIAAAIAASVGATFAEQADATQSVASPPNNEESGFWRIAHNGTSVKAWSTLVQSGDIVRLGWAGGGFHTLTVVEGPRVSDGRILVTDNTGVNDGGDECIDVHWVNYDDTSGADQRSIASTVTIYRLTTDGLYLTSGTDVGETLLGTVFNDDMRGDGGDDTLRGGGGNDVFSGGGGEDYLVGGRGRDSYFLTDFTNNRFDRVVEGLLEGHDTVFVSKRPHGGDTYTLPDNVEDGVVVFSSGFTLIGNSISNDLSGDRGRDVLKGGGGDDTLNGGRGFDTLYGGKDDDQFTIGDTRLPGDPPESDRRYDNVIEHSGAGVDTVNVAFFHDQPRYKLADNVEIGVILTTLAGQLLSGNTLANRLFGNSSDDTLSGGRGDDTLAGGSGRDKLVGGDDNDTYVLADTDVDGFYDEVHELAGGGDADIVRVSAVQQGEGWWRTYVLGANIEIGIVDSGEAFWLSGNERANALIGNAGDDELYGGEGKDKLTGGLGADYLVGGDGKDTFTFNRRADSTPIARDAIDDFAPGSDLINLSAIDANSHKKFNQAFKFIGTEAFHSQAGELHVVTENVFGTNVSIVEADWNGDGLADLQIRFDRIIAFTKDDFVL